MMTPRERFLTTLDREFSTTMRVLRALPADKADFRPAGNARSARELAWTFALERRIATKIWNDEFANEAPFGNPPAPPAQWDELLTAVEDAQRAYRELIAGASEEELQVQVSFFTGPHAVGARTRLEWLWLMLFDEVHHRGQFSIYLRLAGGRVPSIYGPSEAEPWT